MRDQIHRLEIKIKSKDQAIANMSEDSKSQIEDLQKQMRSVKSQTLDKNSHYKLLEIAKKEAPFGTPQTVIKAIAIQMERLSEAKKRVDEEGIVVRDLKGSVIQHPAIKIEAEATKLLATLLKSSKKTSRR